MEINSQLDFSRMPVSKVLRQVGSSKKGLSALEANQRLKLSGPNVLLASDIKSSSLFRIMWQFGGQLITILVLATAVSFYFHASKVAWLLAVSVVINFLAYRRLATWFLLFIKPLLRLSTEQAKVVRNNRQIQVDVSELVEGDIVQLQRNYTVPADLRLVSVEKLIVDKTPLGSSQKAVKAAINSDNNGLSAIDSPNLTLAGMTIASGEGCGVVIATGCHTVLNQFAQSTHLFYLQRHLQLITTRLVRVAMVIALATLLACLIIGFGRDEGVALAIASVVAILPLGLPVISVLITDKRRLVRPAKPLAIAPVLQCLVTDITALGLLAIGGVVLRLWLHMPLPLTALQIVILYLVFQLPNLVSFGKETSARTLANHELEPKNSALFGALAAAVVYINFLFFFVRIHIGPAYLDVSSTLYAQATSLALLTAVLCQFMNALFVRSEGQTKFFTSYLWKSKKLVFTMAALSLLAINIIYNPLTQSFFGTAPLNTADLLCVLGFSVIYVFARLLQRHTRHHTRHAILKLHREIHGV